jgi:ATP-dependent helicase/nuclease subunit A
MTAPAAFPNVVIRASAGTGKTYQLALRFIKLLAAGQRPDEILATTFTRKAAGEILDRVLGWLATASREETERAKLAAAIGDDSLTQQRCRELLIATLRRLHTLRVGTLDSYFLQIATSFGHELGLPPGWSICEEQVDALLHEEAIELVLSRGKLADLLTLVHALTKGDAARSVSRLVRDTVTSLLELYRETTPEAWQKIAVCKGLDAAEIEDTLAAIESLALASKRMDAPRREDLERFRAANWEAFICTGLAGKVHSGECMFYKQPLPSDLVALYQRLLKHVESILVGQVARQTEATHQLLTHFAEHYRALQLEERALRFGDVTFFLAAAQQRIDEGRLSFRLDGGVRHLLLDEFQDTSPAQWRVLRPLAERVTAGRGGSFFCVGDTKQAIYGWRGGVAEIFDALDGQLKGLTPDSLTTSYRSAQPVIDAVNAVFQNLARHTHLDNLEPPVRAWQDKFPKHRTKRQELSGHVTLCTAPAAAENEDQTERLLKYTAQRVSELLSAAPRASIGVLVRKNETVARLIYLLRKLCIPASEEGGNPLTDSPAVELILSLLVLADHPGDGVARFHIAKSPLATAVSLTDYRDDAAASQLSQNIRRQLLDDGYGPTIFEFAKLLALHCDERDRSRLQQLVELAYEYSSTSTLRTSDFLRLIQTRKIADPQAADVRVMTIHQAKGLQFDVVFLPELEARLVGQPDRFVAGRPAPTEPVDVVCRLVDKSVRQFFPPSLQKLFDDDMCLEVSESLCVLYVAMTRAVHALHLIICPPKGNERTLPKTFAGLLRATLGSGKPVIAASTLYEHGDDDWFKRMEEANPKSKIQNPKSAAEESCSVRLAASLARRVRGLDRTSPSALEGGQLVRGASVLASRSQTALGIGTLFHHWLAEIEWLEDGLPSDDTMRKISAQLRATTGFSDDQITAYITRFRQQLTAKPIADVLSRRYYDSPANLGLDGTSWPAGPIDLNVFRERPFAIRIDNQIVPGSIDRLVVIQSGGKPIGADIIDFKTDDLPPGDKKALAAKVDFYRPQINAYRAAAAKLLSLDGSLVTARLAFVGAEAVEAIGASRR